VVEGGDRGALILSKGETKKKNTAEKELKKERSNLSLDRKGITGCSYPLAKERGQQWLRSWVSRGGE